MPTKNIKTNNPSFCQDRLAQRENVRLQTQQSGFDSVWRQKYVMWKKDFCAHGKYCAIPLRNLTQQKLHKNRTTPSTGEMESGFSLTHWVKGNVAWTNRSYELWVGTHKPYTLLLNSTINSTTTTSSANKLNYDGAQAMDVTGRDRHGSLVRVRPLEGNSEEEYRTVGQGF